MRRKAAFTLTELLIALGLFAVLAAIAIPITIESQARSRVAHARKTFFDVKNAMRAYMVDWKNPFCDNNDYATPSWRKNWWFSKESPGVRPDVVFLVNDNHWMENFYTKAPFIPLTTPVAYMASIPLDPFSSVVPFGYDTRETPFNSGHYAYVTLLAAGPDRTEGNWSRGVGGQGGRGTPYDPSNGTISSGDIWQTVYVP
jgi:prepilin-type N-terminal cleavage/methylation domain-containing protein